MHNCWIRTRNLVQTFCSLFHYAASVNTTVLLSSLIRIICNSLCIPCNRHLATGVLTSYEAPAAPRASAPFGSLVFPGTRLGSLGPGRSVIGTVASQWRLTEARMRKVCRLLLAS